MNDLCKVQSGVHVGEIGLPPFVKAFSEGLPAKIIGSTFVQQLDHYAPARRDIRSLSNSNRIIVGIDKMPITFPAYNISETKPFFFLRILFVVRAF